MLAHHLNGGLQFLFMNNRVRLDADVFLCLDAYPKSFLPPFINRPPLKRWADFINTIIRPCLLILWSTFFRRRNGVELDFLKIKKIITTKRPPLFGTALLCFVLLYCRISYYNLIIRFDALDVPLITSTI